MLPEPERTLCYWRRRVATRAWRSPASSECPFVESTSSGPQWPFARHSGAAGEAVRRLGDLVEAGRWRSSARGYGVATLTSASSPPFPRPQRRRPLLLGSGGPSRPPARPRGAAAARRTRPGPPGAARARSPHRLRRPARLPLLGALADDLDVPSAPLRRSHRGQEGALARRSRPAPPSRAGERERARGRESRARAEIGQRPRGHRRAPSPTSESRDMDVDRLGGIADVVGRGSAATVQSARGRPWPAHQPVPLDQRVQAALRASPHAARGRCSRRSARHRASRPAACASNSAAAPSSTGRTSSTSACPRAIHW